MFAFARHTNYSLFNLVATQTVFQVTSAADASTYIIDGQENPTMSLTRGQNYTFNISASGHPFWIKTAREIGVASAYTSNVTNNGVDSGTLTFTVPEDAPDTLYYQCQYHQAMAGSISVEK